MKKILEKHRVFMLTLRFLAPFAKAVGFNRFTLWATTQAAKTNLTLNKPTEANSPEELAETWLKLMPPDGQQYFSIEKTTEDTAYTRIHLECPLRGSGNPDACHRLMNYDRSLMKKVGGELVVLESQSNSGKPYCRLAIRKTGANLDDLTPAHLKNK